MDDEQRIQLIKKRLKNYKKYPDLEADSYSFGFAKDVEFLLGLVDSLEMQLLEEQMGEDL